MKIERILSTRRNMITGSLLRLFQMLAPFVMRSLIIREMGEQYLGLNSFFTSILQVLNLAELGVGAAMVYSMYKPIAEDDQDALCALIGLYRKYYRVIGLVVAALGLALAPFLPHLVKSELPADLNLYTLYFMNLGATVLSYWLFAYRTSLLTAMQRNDVLNLILLVFQILQYSLQFYIVLRLKNYYLYVGAVLLCQVLNNICGAIVTTRLYPEIQPRGQVPPERRREITGHVKDLFLSNIGGVVLGSADTLVISSVLGLSALAIYQNYFFIVSSIYGFVEILLNSMLAGIGNAMVKETKEKSYEIFRKLTFLFTALVFTCMCCFAGLFQPFMTLWMGEEYLLPYGMVVSFCLYFMVYEYTRFFNIFKSAAGAWHQDRFRPLISAAINLTLNLITVRYWRLYGILWSTIIALTAIELPWLVHNIFTILYDRRHLAGYLRKLLIFCLGGLAAWGIAMLLTQRIHLNAWAAFLVDGILSVSIPAAIYLAFYKRHEEYHAGMSLIDKATNHRLPLRCLYDAERTAQQE